MLGEIVVGKFEGWGSGFGAGEISEIDFRKRPQACVAPVVRVDGDFLEEAIFQAHDGWTVVAFGEEVAAFVEAEGDG